MSEQDGVLRPQDLLGGWLELLPEKKRRAVLEVVEGYYRQRVGDPGEYPFTRGIYATMYRGRRPTIRQFAGHGLAPDTNQRFKTILRLGGTGLSTAFDLPTLMGRDSDDPLCEGHVGWDGVAVDTLADMEDLFSGIPLDQVTVSMTINAPAAAILAMYFAMAQKRGISLDQLGGTTQNDILKEYIAQKEWLFPVSKGGQLVVDTIEFCSRHAPRWHPVSISGYHIREAGATAVQELAYTVADGAWYVQKARERGLDVDEFAPRLSFFFDIHNDFLEEVAKLRAARRLWAATMRDRMGTTDPRSLWCRIHAQTAGCSLTRREPMSNIVRVAVQCLAAMLGGAQSIHTNSYDEVYSTPTEKALKVAVRTQQVLQEETEVTRWVDPLGGSWVIEHLTDKLEQEARQEMANIEGLGGMEAAIEAYYPQRAIHASALKDQRRVETGERKIVGVNAFQDAEEAEEDLQELLGELNARKGFEQRQLQRLRRVKEERSREDVRRALGELQRAAEVGENLMPSLMAAVSTYATVGEVSKALQQVWGEYKERDVISPTLSNQELEAITQGRRFSRPTRILMAKGGLDGHTRGIWILADVFRHMGAEVVYAGLHCSMKEVAKAAVEEDADVVGLSTHIGSPTVFFSRLKEELRHYGGDDIFITGGGILLPDDRRFIEERLGIGPLFPPDTPLQEIVQRVASEVDRREKVGLVHERDSRH
ncbi:MAG: cobalamin B12-binding domain-containing protein [Chloroflexi bacterium]|nr:cobalamin B12-binding domain-containing protein [Chloroflexota bacterium]